MLIDGYVAEQIKNAMLNSEQEQVKIYDAYYNKGYEQGYQDGGSDMEQAKQIIIDELLKQIEQIRADAIDEIFDSAYDIDMDSSLIYLRFDKEKYNVPFMTRKEELFNWFKEQLKEQK